MHRSRCSSPCSGWRFPSWPAPNPRRPRLWFEIVLIAVSYWTYSLIRNAVPEQRGQALRNADWLWRMEHHLGIAVEESVNHAANSVTWLIVGMNYYLPALAEWRSGLSGRVVAWTAEKLAATYNAMLGRVYAKSGARVANVFGAFETSDFTRPAGTSVPRNVARLCQWTWECAAPPRGPNQHANQAGYQVIARAFLQASGLS